MNDEIISKLKQYQNLSSKSKREVLREILPKLHAELEDLDCRYENHLLNLARPNIPVGQSGAEVLSAF